MNGKVAKGLRRKAREQAAPNLVDKRYNELKVLYSREKRASQFPKLKISRRQKRIAATSVS